MRELVSWPEVEEEATVVNEADVDDEEFPNPKCSGMWNLEDSLRFYENSMVAYHAGMCRIRVWSRF